MSDLSEALDVLATSVKHHHDQPCWEEGPVRDLILTLPVPLYTTDSTGRITLYNQTAAELWGREPVLGVDRWCGSWRAHNPDGSILGLDQSPMAITLREGKSAMAQEIVVERPDGTKRWVLPYPKPFLSESGEVVGAVNMLIDVTDRRRAEVETEEKQRQYRFLAESVPCMVWTADSKGDIDYANQTWRNYFGTQNERISREIWQQIIHPEDWPLVSKAYAKCLETGDLFEVQPRLRRHDGKYIWHLVRAESFERQDESGLGWFGTAIDINDLKAQTHALESINQVGANLAADLNSERIIQALTDASTEVIGAQFGSFFYNVINDKGEEYMLYTLSGADKKSFERFGMPRNTPIFSQTFSGESIVRSEDIRNDPRYGQLAPHYGMPEGHLPVRSYLAVPVVSRSREVLGGLFFGHEEPGVFTEIHELMVNSFASQAAVALDNARLYTQLSAVNEQLELRVSERTSRLAAANAELEAFAYSVSHDLRTPLRGIIATSRILIEDALPRLTKEDQNLLQRQADCAQHLAQLIDDLLRLSRITRQDLNLSEVNLSAVAEELVASWSESDSQSYRIAPNIVRQADEQLVRLALTNLLENARKFSRGKGVISIGEQAFGDEKAIFVRDQGIGFDMSYASKLFVPFERLVTEAQFPGTGIGLANVQRIVVRHGGRIWAESEPGLGATFYFTLR